MLQILEERLEGLADLGRIVQVSQFEQGRTQPEAGTDAAQRAHLHELVCQAVDGGTRNSGAT